MANTRTSDPFAAAGHNTIVRLPFLSFPSPESMLSPPLHLNALNSHQVDTTLIFSRRLLDVLGVPLERMRRVLQRRERLQLWVQGV